MILVIVFGALMAAGLPLVVAIVLGAIGTIFGAFVLFNIATSR